ncbi:MULTISPECIES: pyruvate, phosphate dikinase [Caproicibacterium]|jgi:pyruvate,orthophosphate dikinase|uniref:Pyruvate, phosphate dikinase n=1 Tax=Caproicibacterium lactatifermentans TaxID=2666138 RepID=A0A859DNE2_9FIRM|nr:pyruvate, phosphate dikinase [Caproicibacterium lactatifermentans]ARP49431.1 pyruvate, phosphate dikinase [Ruminococcaceae bacterium CPB6]QKN23024.1 pyruvate, phosphate dikinase [Caproicibacterium lactatifermentans]QKO30370.1 pyruvate, phosphate dikinase [Caproicibacterium lactatifermentans]
MSCKYLYYFTEGNKAFKGDMITMKNILGGKGAGLAEMTAAGMPVPQGFTITTGACTQYYTDGRQINDEIQKDIFEHMKGLEKITGKTFGDNRNPLLVSVRSGARQSMPGMMDTILNLGLNDEAVEGLAKKTNNPRFAYDSYRRFVQMFADVVMGVSKSLFEDEIDKMKAEKGYKSDIDLTAEDLKKLVAVFKKIYEDNEHKPFPQDPKVQLIEAVKAVFRSWDNPRANVYRKMNEIPYEWGTAVNVQQMAFGNSGNNSGTGVAFTRNPATGEKKLFGEYLINAQGEDVVAGVRTPSPISHLKDQMPAVYDQFTDIATKLENHFKDMQDMEFTIEDGHLYMLQTRNGKRTATAALKIACDLVDEGMIDKEEAVLRVEPHQLDALLHPQFDPDALKKAEVIGRGLAASPGAACGKVVFSAEDAKAWKKNGEKVVLVRLETSPEDIEGMQSAEGILTVRGGMTSHAAVVARGMGTCCVSGCGEITVDYDKKQFTLGGKAYKEGDYISIDGSTGNIYGEALPTVPASITGNFGRFMEWADKVRTLKVYTNADRPKDAQQASDFGAEGIGLCRTEHMFFEGNRIKAMREMIVAENVEDRKKALAKILPYQQGDFEGLFEIMGERPVTIRFLDPPLHEFLPTKENDIKDLADDLHITVEKLKDVIASLHEFNPMMGHRGCRLTVTYPEIAEMQTTAVINAAINVTKKTGKKIVPQIMIPLVGEAKELKFVKDTVVKTADKIIKDSGMDLKYEVGTMIEIPRAALTAGKIAKEADFFCYGTNDLTQMTFGFSRDDAGKFLDSYYENKIYESDPFVHLDTEGVGRLVKMSSEEGKAANPQLHLGICGEHGGDPSSIEFCHNSGLDYVSCSPFRVPIARLAAAQAAIKENRAKAKA